MPERKRKTTRVRSGEAPPGASTDPTLDGAFTADGVDLTTIRWMLGLTPTERLRAAQDLAVSALILRRGHQP